MERPTIERLDARQIQLPAHVLSVDLTEVGYEEGIFLARVAGIVIDSLDALLQSIPDELLWVVVQAMAVWLQVKALDILVVRMEIRETWVVFVRGGECGR